MEDNLDSCVGNKKTYINSLDKGILIEDNQEFLTWGQSLNEFKEKLRGKKLDKGDRIIYDWGKHEILNGLNVHLSTTLIKTIDNMFNNKFNEINSWVIGDDKAQKEYSRISEHLSEHLGEPTEKDESDKSEKYMNWNFEKVYVSLNFYEQHCFKLVLTIKNSY